MQSAKECARREGPDLIATNSAEAFLGSFTHNTIGTYQHCAETHLRRYLPNATFGTTTGLRLDYSDMARALAALRFRRRESSPHLSIENPASHS